MKSRGRERKIRQQEQGPTESLSVHYNLNIHCDGLTNNNLGKMKPG